MRHAFACGWSRRHTGDVYEVHGIGCRHFHIGVTPLLRRHEEWQADKRKNIYGKLGRPVDRADRLCCAAVHENLPLARRLSLFLFCAPEHSLYLVFLFLQRLQTTAELRSLPSAPRPSARFSCLFLRFLDLTLQLWTSTATGGRGGRLVTSQGHGVNVAVKYARAARPGRNCHKTQTKKSRGLLTQICLAPRCVFHDHVHRRRATDPANPNTLDAKERKTKMQPHDGAHPSKWNTDRNDLSVSAVSLAPRGLRRGGQKLQKCEVHSHNQSRCVWYAERMRSALQGVEVMRTLNFSFQIRFNFEKAERSFGTRLTLDLG